jgi:hypothetical protein
MERPVDTNRVGPRERCLSYNSEGRTAWGLTGVPYCRRKNICLGGVLCNIVSTLSTSAKNVKLSL